MEKSPKLLLLLVVALLLAGCSGNELSSSTTSTPTPIPTGISPTPHSSTPLVTPSTPSLVTPSPTPFQPTPTPTPLFFGVKYSVKVVEVIDGDTIDVRFEDGTIERVRMLGVDTPETTAEKNKVGEYDGITDLECLEEWGKKAREFARQLEGKNVFIEFDSMAGMRGYYGRLLAYVYIDSTDFTAELIKKGYARVYKEGEFVKEEEYLGYENSAINQRIGLWSCISGSTGETESLGVYIEKVIYNPEGDDRENLDKEIIVIKNTGKEINLKGWKITDTDNHEYVFGDLTLGQGESVTLHVGSGVDTSTDVYWGLGRPILDNTGDTITLYNANGEIVDQYSWE
jgi:micrococcal nuclease